MSMAMPMLCLSRMISLGGSEEGLVAISRRALRRGWEERARETALMMKGREESLWCGERRCRSWVRGVRFISSA